jgi:hypothetical protein
MMRLPTPLLLVCAIVGCTRGNPAFGAGDTDDTGREGGDPTVESVSDSVSTTSNVDSGSSGITTTASTSNTTDDSLTGVDTLGPSRDCCAKHSEPGCDQDEVEMCVCSALEACCTEAWLDQCVEKASLCNAGCAVSSSTGHDGGTESMGTSEGGTSTSIGSVTDSASTEGGTTMGVAPCCEVAAVGGCNADPEIEGCVCKFDPSCCAEAWLQSCVDVATETCGLACA